MMLVLHMILRGMPVETRDPDTKSLYGFALILNVSAQVIAAFLKMLMAFVAFDVIADGLVATDLDLTRCMIEYIVGGLTILLPGICLLISTLIYSGFMVEI